MTDSDYSHISHGVLLLLELRVSYCKIKRPWQNQGWVVLVSLPTNCKPHEILSN